MSQFKSDDLNFLLWIGRITMPSNGIIFWPKECKRDFWITTEFYKRDETLYLAAVKRLKISLHSRKELEQHLTTQTNKMQAIYKTWCEDDRLPEAERKDLKQNEKTFFDNLNKLKDIIGSGPWTIEVDLLGFYNHGKRPNKSVGTTIGHFFLGDFTQSIKSTANRNKTFLSRFREATSKCTIVLSPRSTGQICESEFRDGKLILHIREVANISDWGDDMVPVLDSAYQQKGVKLSGEYGEALQSDLVSNSAEKSTAAIQRLIELDIVDLPMTNEHSYPIFSLVYGGRSKALEKLLPHIKNPNVRDQWGNTPLIAAAKRPSDLIWSARPTEAAVQAKIIAVLLKHPDIDVNATDPQDRTALMHIAKSYDWDEAAELMIADPRVDFNFENRKMETALDFAIKSEFTWMIKFLTKHRDLGTKPTVPSATPTQVSSSSSSSSIPPQPRGNNIGPSPSKVSTPPAPAKKWSSSATTTATSSNTTVPKTVPVSSATPKVAAPLKTANGAKTGDQRYNELKVQFDRAMEAFNSYDLEFLVASFDADALEKIIKLHETCRQTFNDVSRQTKNI